MDFYHPYAWNAFYWVLDTMNLMKLTYEQTCVIRGRLYKLKSSFRVRCMIDRLNVVANYKLFYGEEYVHTPNAS